jgi:FkbH-like protein
MDAQLRDAIRSARTFGELAAALTARDSGEFGPREAQLVSRALETLPGSPDLRVAFVANHTLEPLPRFAAAAAARHGLRLATYAGPIDQHFQEVLDRQSGLAHFDPQLILLSLDPRAAAPRLSGEFLSLSPGMRRAECEQLIGSVRSWVAVAREHTRANLLVCNFPRPLSPAAGIADAKLEAGEREVYAELELALLRALRSDPRCSLLDLGACLARAGRERAEDPRLWFVAKQRFADAALPAVADEILRHAFAVAGRRRKLLVLDLDNTLWGGVVGEDGPRGIRIGAGDAVGEAYHAFQQRVLALRERGVVLALCSKNNLADAREAFELRSEMPLRWEHFAARRIDWKPKPDNLRAIAAELSLGLDAMVFADDSPIECEQVRQLLPEVRVIELPSDPSRYAELLVRALDFEQLALLDADRDKSRQYQENARRASLRSEAKSLVEFLASLGTEVEIASAEPADLARVQQLFAKTNQFNLTTRRYSLAEVERFASEARFELLVLRVRDRFGDLGLVGVALVEYEGRRARLDSFVLSCRALGRGIETALANELERRALAGGRCDAIDAEFLPTAKNAPAREFLPARGYRCVLREPDGRERYELTASEASERPCPGIAIALPARHQRRRVA